MEQLQQYVILQYRIHKIINIKFIVIPSRDNLGGIFVYGYQDRSGDLLILYL